MSETVVFGQAEVTDELIGFGEDTLAGLFGCGALIKSRVGVELRISTELTIRYC